MRAKTDHFIMRNFATLKKVLSQKYGSTFLLYIRTSFFYHIIKEIICFFVSLKHIGIIVV